LETPDNSPLISILIRRVLSFIRNAFRQIRQKHLAFLFFIALSTVAWLLRALSDTYIANIEYPVKYINLPPNRILSQPPLEKLTLQVHAFALYSLSPDSTSVYTLTRYARNRLSTELSLANKNIQILDIDPDTLIFNFSRVKKKKLPIRVQLASTSEMFAQQYMLNGKPYTDPDSVNVTGPSFLVDTLKYIFTDPVSFRNLSDTAERKVLLKKINRVTYPLKKVKVIVPVDEFTETDFTVPILKKNVPDTLTLKTFPKSVQVKSIVTYTNYDKVSAELFHAWVDFTAIDPATATRMKVELDSLPWYINNVKLNPRNVEFLIEK
jgi:hypothetical protein